LALQFTAANLDNRFLMWITKLNQFIRCLSCLLVEPKQILYTTKLSSEKTFAVVHKMHYSPENLRCIRPWPSCTVHSKWFKGKLSQSAEKPRKLSHLPYMVSEIYRYPFQIHYPDTGFELFRIVANYFKQLWNIYC